MHEGVRDVSALLAVRQLAGNAMRTVAVERRADELQGGMWSPKQAICE